MGKIYLHLKEMDQIQTLINGDDLTNKTINDLVK